MEFNKKFLSLEAELSNFCPRVAVNFGEALKNEHSGMVDGKVQRHAFVILHGGEFNAKIFTTPRRLQKVQVGFARRLAPGEQSKAIFKR